MIDLIKFVEAYEGNPHQIAALRMLEDLLPNEILSPTAEWVECYQAECEIINTTPFKGKKEWQ